MLMYNSIVLSLVSDKYLAEEICKKSVDCVAWFLFTVCKEDSERTDKLKELLSKREPAFENLECSQPIHIAKNEKACSGEDTKGVSGQSLHKAITHNSVLINSLSRSQE